MIYFKLVVILFLFGLSSPVYSLYHLNENDLNPKDLNKIYLFLQEVENLLPVKMVARIKKQHVTVPVSMSQNFSGQEFGFYDQKKNIIHLSKHLLPYIIKRSNLKTPKEFSHSDYYTLAQATLIHETAHCYDQLNFRTKKELKAHKRCIRHNKKYCKSLIKDFKRTTSISSSISFIKTAKWLLEGTSKKNDHIISSPDAYELSNISEYFAVNMEYFLLDPDYSLKRPTHYYFFAKHFNMKNLYKDIFFEKKVSTILPSIDPDKQNDIKPKFIDTVEYVYVDQGNDTSSNWGHSLLRLRGCAKKNHDLTSNNCPQKDTIDLVFSFAAKIDSRTINVFKGVWGGYPSKAHLFSFEAIKNKYTITQNRNLMFYPLKLNKEQKYLLIYKLLEEYWGYRGNYKFFSNNCATEVRDILQVVFEHPSIKYSATKTPQGVLNLLKKEHLVDLIRVHQEPSIEQKITLLFQFAKDFDFEDIIPKNAQKRKHIYLRLLRKATHKFKEHSTEWLQTFKHIIKLEKMIRTLRIHEYKTYLSEKIDELTKSNNQSLDILKIKEFMQQLSEASTYHLTDYGIPLYLDFSYSAMILTNLNQAISDFEHSKEGKKLFRKYHEENLNTDNNLEFLGKKLLSQFVVL